MAKKKRASKGRLDASDDIKPEKKEQEILFKASEWARNNNVDPDLFVHWDKDGLIGKDKFEELKNKVMR